MKNQYNIKTNPPNLSSEQIEQHRDFDALLKAFEQAPSSDEETHSPSKEAAASWTVERPKRRPYVLYMLTAVAAAVLLVVALRQNRGAASPALVPPTGQMAELLDLQKPLPHIEQAVERLTIADAAQGEILHYPSGSEVVVPAAAFVDSEGRPVEGAVEIEYREFADAIDMFLAGVPQQLGKHQNLQSTGMMEIKGFQNGEPVYLNMDKKLDVNLRGRMASNTDTEELGVYVYSTQEDTWQYEGKDRIERLEAIHPTTTGKAVVQPEARQAAEHTLASSRPQKPIKPGISDDMQVFDFDIDINEYPELAAYNHKVEFISKKDELPAATFDTVWNAMEIISKGNQTYELQLVYETEGAPIVRTFEVYPAIASTPEARAAYEAQKADYEVAMTAWEVEVTNLALQNQPEPEQQLVGIINHFSIRRFGLWNCGKPIEWNQQVPVATQFVSEEGLPLNVAQVFVTTPAQQLYYSAPSQDANTADLQYTQEATPTIWAMSDDGGLWVASAPAAPEEGTTTIPMKGLTIPNTEQDLRTMLVF